MPFVLKTAQVPKRESEPIVPGCRLQLTTMKIRIGRLYLEILRFSEENVPGSVS